MIEKSGRGLLLTVLLVAAGCREPSLPPHTFQGIIEHEERLLGFEMGGRVTQVKVARGQTVKTGDLLAELDDTLERTAKQSREAEAAAARAQVALLRAGNRPEQIRAMEAQIRAARANEALLCQTLARNQKLVESGALAQAQVDDLEHKVQMATADRQALEQQLEALKSGARRQEIASAEARAQATSEAVRLEAERIDRHDLRAVADGTVLDVHVDPGEIVAAGVPVVTVADTRRPYADVFVPQAELGGVHVNQPARVRVDAEETPLPGRVESIARRTEFTPRYLFSERERFNLVVRVRVRIDDPGERLHAGVPAFVTLETDGQR
jgi:HlyD family secretion protein